MSLETHTAPLDAAVTPLTISLHVQEALADAALSKNKVRSPEHGMHLLSHNTFPAVSDSHAAHACALA